jgi:acyl dehydratase
MPSPHPPTAPVLSPFSRGALPRPYVLGMVALAALAGCTAAAPKPTPQAAPARAQGVCSLLTIEQVTSPSVQPDDSIQIVATYGFESSKHSKPAHAPVALSFRTTRSRMDELDDHLRTHPTVVCEPEGDHPWVQVAPFDGQYGQPER